LKQVFAEMTQPPPFDRKRGDEMGGQKKAPSQTGVKGLSSSLKWA
jgi:hypothetical protein